MFLSFVHQVKKEFQPETKPFSVVICWSREGNINLISNFSFEKTSAEVAVVLFKKAGGGLYVGFFPRMILLKSITISQEKESILSILLEDSYVIYSHTKKKQHFSRRIYIPLGYGSSEYAHLNSGSNYPWLWDT